MRLRKNQVKFVGFFMSDKGMRVEDEKLKAVRNFRRPETVLEVKSFLGFMNFSERFIYMRADKTKHLRELAKSESFYWTESEEDEFVYLKHEALKSISRLGYFSYKDETELYVDASRVGLGAALVQFDTDSQSRIIACASKALTRTEQKYPQRQREALAIVWGVERFSFYLTSKTFTIRRR